MVLSVSLQKSRTYDILIVSVLILIYNVVINYYCFMRYWSFQAGAYDFGIMVQTLWNTANGDILVESVNMGRPASRFWNGRWEIIFLPLAALYRLSSKPELLLFLQTFVVSLGIIPVYLLSKRLLAGVFPAVLLAVVYMVNPIIHNPNLFDFHSVTLAIPLIISLFYVTECRKHAGWIVLFFSLALFCRADIAPLLAAFSLYLIFKRHGKLLPASLFIVAVAWLFLSRSTAQIRELLDLPEIVNVNVYSGRWDHIGGTNPAGVAKTIVTDPLPVLRTLINTENIKYLVKILGPFGFLPVLQLQLLFVAAPNMFINAMSTWPVAHHFEHHYNAHVGAVLMTATIYAAARVPVWLTEPESPARRSIRMILLIVVLSASSASAVLRSNYRDIDGFRPTGHHRELTEMIRDVSGESTVTAHFFILDHVAHRKELYLFPEHVGSTDVVLYDIRLPFNRTMSHASISHRKADPLNVHLKRLLNDRRYGIAEYRDGSMLFRKGASRAGGLRKLVREDQLDDFTRKNIELSGDMVIDAVRRNGIGGAGGNLVGYTIMCRRDGPRKCRGLTFLVTDGSVARREHCSTMLESVYGSEEAVGPGGHYVDEVFVPVSRDLDRSRDIRIYVQNDEREFSPFDALRELRW